MGSEPTIRLNTPATDQYLDLRSPEKWYFPVVVDGLAHGLRKCRDFVRRRRWCCLGTRARRRKHQELRDRFAHIDPRLQDFLRGALGQYETMDFQSLPDSLVLRLADALQGLSSPLHHYWRGGLRLRVLSRWRSPSGPLSADEFERHVLASQALAAKLAELARKHVQRRVEFRNSLPPRSRLLLLLKQRVRDQLEGELGLYLNYRNVASWILSRGLTEHAHLFDDYRIPTRAHRLY